MPESGSDACVFHPGLIGVYFPGVDIEDEGLILLLVDRP